MILLLHLKCHLILFAGVEFIKTKRTEPGGSILLLKLTKLTNLTNLNL